MPVRKMPRFFLRSLAPPPTTRCHLFPATCPTQGGKGRTGVVIAAYMLQARIFDDVEQAMEHFAIKRFDSTDRTKTGITQYSQKRYVRYFQQVIEGNLQVRDRQLFLKNIVMSMVPDYDTKGGCRPVVKMYEFPPGDTQAMEVHEYPGSQKSVQTEWRYCLARVFWVRWLDFRCSQRSSHMVLF